MSRHTKTIDALIAELQKSRENEEHEVFVVIVRKDTKDTTQGCVGTGAVITTVLKTLVEDYSDVNPVLGILNSVRAMIPVDGEEKAG